MNPSGKTLCGGPSGCGHPLDEHTRQVDDSQVACTHQLSKSGGRATCACKRFKEIRVGSSGSRTAVGTGHG